jgi:predicted nucleic-acid-binding protein
VKGIDTNILVRYVVKDDLSQWQSVSDYLEAVDADNDICLINNIVLCEFVWVLRSAYKLPKSEIIEGLGKILSATLFIFEDEVAVRSALEPFKQGNADFSDYLIGQGNRQAGCAETATFDQKLKGADGFRLL